MKNKLLAICGMLCVLISFFVSPDKTHGIWALALIIVGLACLLASVLLELPEEEPSTSFLADNKNQSRDICGDIINPEDIRKRRIARKQRARVIVIVVFPIIALIYGSSVNPLIKQYTIVGLFILLFLVLFFSGFFESEADTLK